MSQIRPTSVHVDLDRLVHNFRQVRAAVPLKTRILCPVKGNAYGHGLVPCALALEGAGADFFGVALVEEGADLRAAGVSAPILCLGGIGGRGAQQIIEHDLTPMVFDMDSARALDQAAAKAGRPVQVHLKVDTGLGRLGVPSEHWLEFLDRLADLEHVRVQGIATHFACADEDTTFTREQARRFRQALDAARLRGYVPDLVHAANSAAALLYEDLRFDMVRPGIALYGHGPGAQDHDLRPVMRVSTEVLFVKNIPANYGVSYGRRWVSQRPSRLATLPVGYADGYPRSLSNLAHVSVHGVRCPVRGIICMDLCMVDVTDLEREVRPGDSVELLGDRIPAEELAQHAGSIVYEILTGFSERVPRLHRGSLPETGPGPG